MTVLARHREDEIPFGSFDPVKSYSRPHIADIAPVVLRECETKVAGDQQSTIMGASKSSTSSVRTAAEIYDAKIL